MGYKTTHEEPNNPKTKGVSKLKMLSNKVICRSVFNIGCSPLPDRLNLYNKTSVFCALQHFLFKNILLGNMTSENSAIRRLQEGQTYYQKPLPHFLYMQHFTR